MTTAEWALIVSSLSMIFSCLAAFVAIWTLARTIAQQIPTIEFLVENDGSGRNIYRISVSNPTHRLLVLDYVEVLSPEPNSVSIQPMEVTLRGTLERSWEDASRKSKERKSVFLEIPSRKTEYLEIALRDHEEFEIDFKLQWSKNLPILDRCFIAQRIKLDVAEVNSRILAATARASRANS